MNDDETRNPPGLGLGDPCGREDLRIALGALALGALDADEARDVRQHLATCPECQAEYQSFIGVRTLMDAGLVGGLARAENRTPAVEVARPKMPRERKVLGGRGVPGDRRGTGVAGAPGTAGAGPSPRRRLVLAMAGAAASVALVAAGSFALGQRTAPSSQVQAAAHVATATGYQGISARISFSEAAWGTTISTKMDGVPADYHCTLWAVGKDGSRHNAGSWTSDGSATFTVPGAVDIPASQIDRFVLDLPGQQELTAPVAASA